MQCPLHKECLAGRFSEGDRCPSYHGTGKVNGVPVAKCSSEEDGYCSRCPKCGSAVFRKQNTDIENWLCTDCGFYFIPDHVDTHLDHVGTSIKVRCSCGLASWIFPEPGIELDRYIWTCDACGKQDTVQRCMTKRKRK